MRRTLDGQAETRPELFDRRRHRGEARLEKSLHERELLDDLYEPFSDFLGRVLHGLLYSPAILSVSFSENKRT